MRLRILFVAFLIYILHTKKSFALSVQNGEIQEADIIETILKEYDGRFSISQTWETIKDGLRADWESIVVTGKETLEKIKILIHELRRKTDEILEMVKQHLNEMRENIKDQFERIAKRSEEMAVLVRQCYQSREQEIEDKITDAFSQIRNCMFTTNKTISELEKTANKEMFIKNVKSKLDLCASDIENVDQCLTNVRNYINWKDEINDAKITIDRILSQLLFCSTNRFTDASEKIYEKVNVIGKCVDQILEI